VSRSRTAVAAAAAAVLVLGGCDSNEVGGDGSAREGGSVAVALAAPPDSLDPALGSSPQALQALWLTNTPPLTYARAEGAAGARVVPALAEKEPELSEDAQRLELILRRGLRYSDGRPVRPADLERGIRRSMRLNPRARRAFRAVRMISISDRSRTVAIHMSKPDALLPYALAAPWAAPVPAGTPDRELSAVPGVGPYAVARHGAGDAYVLKRRRRFDLPGLPGGRVDVISGRVLPSAARRARAVIAGRADVVQESPPLSLLPEIRSKYADRYEEYPTLAARFLRFDLERRPFRDKRVRRAVSFALDERTLARLEDGFLFPSCNLLPPAVPGSDAPDPCPYGERQGNADLIGARKLVEGSRGRRTPVLVDGGEGPRAGPLARYGASTLDKIGLRARPARTPRERRRAQVRFETELPPLPHPSLYFRAIDEALLGSRVAFLALEGAPDDLAGRWAELDRQVVERALLAPFGVATVGVLLSERLDAANCARFHPVHGIDLASLCLR
jgi:peptide/nickel transport system substrate-binding protein